MTDELLELADAAELLAPEVRTEDEALASSLEFVALRLRRLVDRQDRGQDEETDDTLPGVMDREWHERRGV